jgi:hypothetical protein
VRFREQRTSIEVRKEQCQVCRIPDFVKIGRRDGTRWIGGVIKSQLAKVPEEDPSTLVSPRRNERLLQRCLLSSPPCLDSVEVAPWPLELGGGDSHVRFTFSPEEAEREIVVTRRALASDSRRGLRHQVERARIVRVESSIAEDAREELLVEGLLDALLAETSKANSHVLDAEPAQQIESFLRRSSCGGAKSSEREDAEDADINLRAHDDRHEVSLHGD